MLAEKVFQLELSAPHSVRIPAGEAQGFTPYCSARIEFNVAFWFMLSQSRYRNQFTLSACFVVQSFYGFIFRRFLLLCFAILLSLMSLLTRGQECGGVTSNYLSDFTDSSQMYDVIFMIPKVNPKRSFRC